MQFVEQIQNVGVRRAVEHRLHAIANLWQEVEQHLQKVTGQIGLVGRLTQRQGPVERQRRFINGNGCRRYRVGFAAVIAGQHAGQHGFVNRFGQIVIHAGLQQMFAFAADRMGGDGDDRR
ncbi:hypothetical protein D3C78_1528610 [compost metagenome]